MDELNPNDFELNMGFDEDTLGEDGVDPQINTWVICSIFTNITEGIDCATAGITATY